MNIKNKKTLKINKKNYFVLTIFLGLLFCLQVHLKFIDFQDFLYKDDYEVLVLNNYLKTKKSNSYYVLTLKYKDVIIYTNTKNKITSNHLLIKFAAKDKMLFYDYFKAKFYLPSYDIVQLENYKNNYIVDYFLNQHENYKTRQIYGAMFFANHIDKDIRNDINYYGIAHLLAISGYHLGLIYTMLFFIFAFIYKQFQSKFFPYRSIHFDLGCVIFIILSIYFYQIGMVASFFRSFIMAILGFYFVIRAIKLLSFSHLLLACLVCIAINPSLIFSVGFFFSVLGIFYIYLFMYHFEIKNILGVLALEISVFLAMTTPVLYFFPLLSFQQLLGIFITIIFVVFYPLVLFLHIINFGDLFDSFLISFLNFKIFSTNISISTPFLISYIFLSLLAVLYRYLAIFVISINLIFYFYLGFL